VAYVFKRLFLGNDPLMFTRRCRVVLLNPGSSLGTAVIHLEMLKALSKLSPVFDMISHGTNVQVNIEIK
jgi:hypothetical protein